VGLDLFLNETCRGGGGGAGGEGGFMLVNTWCGGKLLNTTIKESQFIHLAIE
jgi:hypothetical protein